MIPKFNSVSLKMGQKVRLVALSLLAFVFLYFAVTPGTNGRYLADSNIAPEGPPTIIFFFHVPKAGGSTVKATMRSYDIKERLSVINEKKWRRFSERLLSAWYRGTENV